MSVFNKVKRYYDMGIYKAAHVAAIVRAGKLTAEEYEAIVGCAIPPSAALSLE